MKSLSAYWPASCSALPEFPAYATYGHHPSNYTEDRLPRRNACSNNVPSLTLAVNGIWKFPFGKGWFPAACAGNPDGNMDEHGFITSSAAPSILPECRWQDAVYQALCAWGWPDGWGKLSCTTSPFRITFRRQSAATCAKALLDFLFRERNTRKAAEAAPSTNTTEAAALRGETSEKEKAASCLLRQPVTASHVATLPRSPPALSSLRRQDDCGTKTGYFIIFSHIQYIL